LLLEFQRDFVAAIGPQAEGPMRIYRNTVASGCVDALRANYPIVARLLGSDMFDAVTADHAAEFPPTEPVLAHYGARFPDWLDEQPWIWDAAYVADVARIERLHIEALFAEDAEPLEMSALSGRHDWLEMRLALHPATRFAWLPMPAMSIWLAQRDEVEGEIEPQWQAEGVLLTRPALEVRPMRLGRAGHRFLSGIRLGDTIGDAAIATSSLYPETDIGSLFTSLVTTGAFAAAPNRSLP
jgi:hypothetical protein